MLEKWFESIRASVKKAGDAGSPIGACLLSDPTGGPSICVQVDEATCKNIKGVFLGGACPPLASPKPGPDEGHDDKDAARGKGERAGSKRSGRRRGGVSPLKEEAASGPASGAARHADFVYNGGAVIRAPQVYTSFWGPRWSDATHAARAERMNQFLRDLLNSSYMNVLSQYGVGSGAGAAGRFVKSSFVADVPSQLDEVGIAEVIQKAINSGTLPEPPAADNNIVLVVYLDETIAVNQPGLRMCEPDSDDAFGFHFDFVTSAGNEFYYAVIPALDDNCIKHTCQLGGCSLQLSQTQEQRLTQVTSHEFAEMCTDPKFQAGWFGPDSDENGDICNGQPATITVGPNTWTVQRQYSKNDDETNGGTNFCVIGALNPMPKRDDGPA